MYISTFRPGYQYFPTCFSVVSEWGYQWFPQLTDMPEKCNHLNRNETQPPQYGFRAKSLQALVCLFGGSAVRRFGGSAVTARGLFFLQKQGAFVPASLIPILAAVRPTSLRAAAILFPAFKPDLSKNQ